MEGMFVEFFWKVAGCFVHPIKRVINAKTDYLTERNAVQDQCKDITVLLPVIENQVNQAHQRREKVIEGVERWLEEAKAMQSKVSSWLDEVGNTIPICGPCLNCCKLYKLTKKATKMKKSLAALVQRGNHIKHVAIPGSPQGIHLLSNSQFMAFESATNSFNDALKALDRNNTKIIGIVGMGGIGKTTLVTEVGRVAKEEKQFQVVFAVVSQSPDIRKIQGQLGDMLGLTFSAETELGRAGQLSDWLGYGNKKVLIILDDVWNKIDLGSIGIPLNEGCCKVILTTRRDHVCTSMQCQVTIRLTLLDESEAWQLFKNNVGGVLNNPSDEFRKVAQEVINECQRLPLALVVVGCALKESDLEGWKSAADRLKKSRIVDIETIESDRNVYGCFKLSYDYLKANAAKKCFLLCSLFPEDHEIDVEELARYAMGFGLFDDVDSYDSVKTRVQSTITDLKQSSLLLKTENMSKHVKMHDMVRDAALWITTENNEPFIVPTHMDDRWTKNAQLDQAVAISLLARPNNDRLPVQHQYRSLKVLLCAQQVPLHLADNCFQGMETLQVLDLTAAKNHLELILPSSLGRLQKLQTLLLRRWKLRGDISVIGCLKSLEILSFSGSFIVKLPLELGNLPELRFLDLSGCKELDTSSYIDVQIRLPRLELIYTPNQRMTLPFGDNDLP